MLLLIAHGGGDDATVRELLVFHCGGWDHMRHDLRADVDLGPY
jgi:hypothetical protein